MDFTGTAANEAFDGAAADELIVGAGGDDTLSGGAGADTLAGGDGNDFLRAQGDADSLAGGNGDDFLNGGSGDDVIDGGAGVDRVSFGDAPGGVTVDLTLQGQAQDTGYGADVLNHVEQVSGTEQADRLIGDDGDNWLWSLGGDDTVSGGGGDDLIAVGAGAVHADGGSGNNDTLLFYSQSLALPVNVSLALQGGAQPTGDGSMTFNGFENLVGTTVGADTLAGDGNDNIIAGWGGADSLSGGGGGDTLLGDGAIFIGGAAGAGPITVFEDDGAAAKDTLAGGAGNDLLVGGGGNDLLDGGADTDVAIFSGARADYSFQAQSDGSVTVTDLRGGSPDGVDRLVGVEIMRFSDGDTVFLTGVAGSGGAGEDLFQGGEGAETFTGLGGDDTLGGAGGDDSLGGGDGNDFIRGQNGADSLAAGDGDDFLSGGAGNDVIDGGAGVDRASYGDAPGGVTVDLSLHGQAQNTGHGVDTLSNIEQLSGTESADRLTGDDGDNWLWGLGGSDTISGGGGDDLIAVGAGAVRADGGDGTGDTLLFYSQSLAHSVNVSLGLQGAAQPTGNGSMTFTGFENLVGTTVGGDTLAGDGGANIVAGWGGADSISGGAGNDTLLGDGTIFVDGAAGAGPITVFDDDGANANDTLRGETGDDLLIGGGGDDLLFGGPGADTLDGGAGVDTASYANATIWVEADLDAGTASLGGVPEDVLIGVENLVGTSDWDGLFGDAADNQILAGAGHDYLGGRDGADTLRGEAGDDALSGGGGNDILDGGAGLDRAAFSAGATAGVTVDLRIQNAAQNTGQGVDTLIGIENLSGTRYSDSLTGDDGANWLWGGSDGSGVTGNDTISAGGGADLVQVGAGDHLLDGGVGPGDTLSFNGNGTDIAAGVTVTLGSGAAQATGQGLVTLSNFENLSGSTFGDTLSGDGGGNVLAGYDGADSLSGGNGDDVLLGDGVIVVDSHAPVGTSGAIVTRQNQGGGADTLDGGAGADLIRGDDGADVLRSGTGADTLDGGAGADTLVAQAGAGEVTLITLGAGADKLTLDPALAGTVTVTDFQAGAGGDVLDLASYLTAKLSGWDGTANPFQAGFLRLLQSGSTTLLQVNADGAGDDFVTVASLQNTSTLQFTAANLGYAPVPRVVGAATGDTFVLDVSSFTAGTPGHSIEVDGGQGADEVHIVVPALVGAASTIMPSADGTALLMDLDGDGITDLTITNVEDIVLNGTRVVISGDLSGTGLAPNTIHYQGTAGDDLLDAGGLSSLESVRAQGLDGDDTLIGADDDDTLDGGDGADSLVGNGGPDLFEGGAGDDTLDGGADVDTAIFSGLHGDYTVSDVGGGVVEVSGADGTDRLTGIEVLQFDDGAWGENLAPAGGDRSISVAVGASKVLTVANFGFSDADGDALAAVTVTTLPAVGVLKDNGVAVTAGQVISVADILAGHLVYTPAGAGAASFTFQVHDDGLVGWGSNLDASPNTLTITASSAPPPPPPPPPGPVVITSGSTGTDGDDVASFGDGADTFTAGGGHDSVAGGAGDDVVQGNAGADTLAGGLGQDVLYGGRDNDHLSGDEGDDWLSGDLGDDSLAGGAGADTAFGGEGADTLASGDGESYLRGGLGNDVVGGGADFDDVHGNEGDDTVSGGGGGDWVVGGKDQDLLFGDADNDIVYGNLGADTCNGGDGADLVRGGQDNDVVNGGAGDDWLSGDRGDDTLSGGAGADVFHSFGEAGLDRVLDFSEAEGDRVQLDAGTTYTVAQVGADTVISLSGGGQLVLVGVQSAALTGDWIFSL